MYSFDTGKPRLSTVLSVPGISGLDKSERPAGNTAVAQNIHFQYFEK
jgi:hypothetical protein